MRRTVGPVSVAFALLVVAATLFFRADRSFRDVRNDPVPAPVTADVDIRHFETSRIGSVAVEWEPVNELAWEGEPGVVTEVFIEEGMSIVNGDKVVRVDTEVLRYLGAGAVPYRNVEQRSVGPDAENIDVFLDATVDSEGSRRSKILTYQRENGFEPADGIFRPSYVAWNANPETVVEHVDVVVGDGVEPGHVIARSQPVPSSTRVIDSSGTALTFGSFTGELALELSGSGASASLPVVDGIPRGDVPADLFADVVPSTDTELFDAQFEFRSDAEYPSIPTSALVVVDDDTVCVAAANDGRWTWHQVVVVGEADGVAYLGEIASRVHAVVTNPWVLGDDRITC